MFVCVLFAIFLTFVLFFFSSFFLGSSSYCLLHVICVKCPIHLRVKKKIAFRLYCYAQKHVKSIRAVTRPGVSGEIVEKQQNRYRSIRRKPKKKFKVRHLHHSSPYHVSDHKAAITVGVIMGVFLICWVPLVQYYYIYFRWFFFINHICAKTTSHSNLEEKSV